MTALVVGLREEGTQQGLADQVRQETNFSGPILVVVEAPCTPPQICSPAYYQSIGSWEAGDGAVAIDPKGDRLYYVKVTRRDFGWLPAVATALLLPAVLALVYSVTEWLRVRARRQAAEREAALRAGCGRGPAPHDRPSTATGPGPRSTPWPNGRSPVHPPLGRAVRTADVPAVHGVHSPAMRATTTADPPAPSEAPRDIAVHVDASGLPELAQLFASGDSHGIARTHVDAAGGYAEFGELVVWVDNADPDSRTACPGDRVRAIALRHNGLEH
ncbi:hypothetical protein [Nocardia sp. NPDC019304]|uniref:hypothetical protein n=1 Tax=unclassified Nocardia TaxID=2637762 RepID=UPI0033DBF088